MFLLWDLLIDGNDKQYDPNYVLLRDEQRLREEQQIRELLEKIKKLPWRMLADEFKNPTIALPDDASQSEGDRELPPETRLPESTVRHAFALYQLPSTEEGFADVQIVAADAPLARTGCCGQSRADAIDC